MIGSKKIICFAVLVFVITILSSCGSDDGKNGIFKTVISGNPATLDPQTAVSDSSVGIIENMFTGLFRFGENGEVMPAMAESYTVSDNGLVWEFKLSENYMWYDGEDFSAPCTAYDYVFAFRRLLKPETKAPKASDYYCIKNAERLNKGIITDTKMVGVEAVGDYELKITLEEPCSIFRNLLAQAPAMPCSEEFFYKTEGRYGLDDESVASNGDFYLYSWHYDKWSNDSNYIILRRNKLNDNDTHDFISPYGLNYFIDADGFGSFLNGETHCYISENEDENEKLKNYNKKLYNSSVYGLVFNCDGIFSNTALRTVLGASISRNTFSDNFVFSKEFIPSYSSIGSLKYRENVGMTDHKSYSDKELEKLYLDAVSEIGKDKFSGLKFIMPENEDLRGEVSNILQMWQKEFGFYCNISELNSADYLDALSGGSYDIALYCLEGGESAVSFINCFAEESSENYFNVNNKKLNHIIKSAVTAADDIKAAEYCKEGEQLIIDMFYFVPLMQKKDFVFYAKGVSNIEYNQFNKTFIFRNALIE